MQTRTIFIVSALIAAALTRVLPHPPNFTPIAALALFGGAMLADWKWAFIVPISAMFFSDLILEAGTRLHLFGGWLAGSGGFHQGWWVVYGAFALIVGIGLLLKTRRTVPTTALAAVISSLLFFVVTNLAVWAFDSQIMYTKDWAGLVNCFYMALPFYEWTAIGDLVFAVILFGSFALAEKWVPAMAAETARA